MTLSEIVMKVRITRTEPDNFMKSELQCINQICWRALWIMLGRIKQVPTFFCATNN